ncbi:MAG: TonB-dependent receptor domain-containing protein, partial [Steroidobacterales bacterium]
YSQVYGDFSVANPLVLQPALDPFARADGVNPAALENLYGVEQINARSQLESIDARVVGQMFELPAGKIGLAVGASARREILSGHTDANGRVTDPVTGLTTGNDQLWQGGTFADPFKKHRDISALFVETRLPVTGSGWNVSGFHAFDLTAAVRAEKYSDAGSSNVPKFGFRWEPIDKQFTLHGDYSESFSAPSLYAEYGPTDTRQVGAGVIQGVFGANYTGMPFNGEDGNNPNLKPATSSSRSIGLTFRPEFAPGLSVSADFSSISLHGFAGGLGFNNILLSINTLGSASPYFSNLAVDNFPGLPGATQPFANPGDLQTFLTSTVTGNGDPAQANRLYLIDQFRNLATLVEHSYIVNLEYAIPSESRGTFTVSTVGAIFSKFNFQDLPGHAFIEYAGHTNNAGASGGFGGTLPKYRFFTTLDWLFRNFDLTLSNTYVSSTTDTGVNGTSAPPINVDRYMAWDFRAAYDWKLSDSDTGRDVTFAVGVNNFTDEMPPLAPRAFLDNNADVATFSPIGRLIYGSVAVKF